MKKRNNKKNIIEFAIADLRKRKIYTTTGTYKRSLVFGSAAAEFLNGYRCKYPDFKVEVNDEIFFKILFPELATSTI